MKLSTSQIPLIINVESHIFIEAYKKAKKNKCIFNIEKTLTFLKPSAAASKLFRAECRLPLR